MLTGKRKRDQVLFKETVKILIIDDEESIRDACRQTLSRMGYRVESTGDALYGLEMALKDIYDLVLLDIRMPGMGGLDILRKLKYKSSISARVIIITGYGTIEMAVEAMRYGAHNFLTKPFSAKELKKAVEDALVRYDMRDIAGTLSVLIGNSDYMKELKETIRRIAQTDSTVLITGESGTGKELVARIIHGLAFSGATESREGRFQMADKGTLFLDEISNISLNIQAKLLRVIQEQEVPRVGSSSPEKVDVRLIVATNKDIRAEVESGKFREDLFYRISVVPIDIEPLREHKSDILPIARHYFDIYKKRHNSKVQRLSEEAKKSLTSYSWPGNVRELKNTMERLCVLCENDVVNLSDILYYGQNGGARIPVVDSLSGKMTLVDVEKDHIEKVLRHFNFQIGKTAKFLGIDRKTLRMKIRNYGIRMEQFGA
ncbi:MAG: hypothetical protein B1H13_04790 [Desulfobacteraceae bacterium 4484_190.3]|nr:MAG: hypothetical protein B1H13_04790 [Desulfobacteraceae bacterium 4484_190.3]